MFLLVTEGFAPNVALSADCGEARKWYEEGLALSDNSEQEASYYEKAIALCPEFAEAHNRLGLVYKSWGKYEEAIKEFELAGRKEAFVDPYYNLGEIHRIQGRYDLAAEAFVEALRIRPDFRKAQNQLKYVYKRLGKYDFVIDRPPEPIPISIFTRIPGMTLPKGTFLLDFQYKYWVQEAEISEEIFVGGEIPPLLARPEDREVSVNACILGIRYGVTDDFTVGLLPMFFRREADVDLPAVGVHAEPRVSGFGDTVVMTKYRLWGKARTHLSAYHLLSIPTGDEEAEGEDKGVVRKIQMGSGSFDFTPGLAFTTVRQPFTLHATTTYTFTEGRQAGDEFRCNLAVAFPRFHSIVTFLELNYRWRDDDERDQLWQSQLLRPPIIGPPFDPRPGGPVNHKTIIKEEGGHTLFLSPGLHVTLTKGLMAELGVQIPVIKTGDGWQEKVLIHFGLRKYLF
jgi:hypothetical protein